jgi:hypothetical protein
MCHKLDRHPVAARHGRKPIRHDAPSATDAIVRGIGAVALGVMASRSIAGVPAAGGHIAIGKGDCNAGVHLVARHAPLSDVLRRLSEALSFELRLAGSSDSMVDVDVSRPAPELLAKLSPPDNLIVTQGLDPRCPGRYRVVKVWMLPKAAARATAIGPPAAISPVVSRGGTPRQLSEAEKRAIKSGDDAYRRMHGMPPMPPQDDASK